MAPCKCDEGPQGIPEKIDQAITFAQQRQQLADELAVWWCGSSIDNWVPRQSSAPIVGLLKKILRIHRWLAADGNKWIATVSR